MDQGPRTIMAVLLSIGVIVLYTMFFAPAPAPVPAPVPLAQQTLVGEPTQNLASQNLASQNLASAPALPSAETPFFSVVPETGLARHYYEGEQVRVGMSANGGMVAGWELKSFHRDTDPESPFIDLVGDNGGGGAFHLQLEASGLVVPTDYQFTAVGPQNPQVLIAENDELRIKKIYQFSHEGHFVDLSIEIQNKTNQNLLLNPRLYLFRSQKEQKKSGFLEFFSGQPDVYFPALFQDGAYQLVTDNILPPMTEKSGQILWSGLTDRYFLLGLIARQAGNQVSAQYGQRVDGKLYTSLSYGPMALSPGQVMTQNYSAYLGPKHREALQAIGANLEASIDYGWFGWIAIPLLKMLIFFQRYVGNWGLAIIVLTLVVKLALHPINKKSMTSMKAMQKIQPELKALREKFSTDKQKLNLEMMNLFKAHGVNPMGGCLPMLIQFPFYIGLYKVLWNAVELYHAPFFGIYKDLSMPDPWLISPVLLGIFMVLQQKLTPQAATMDPAQQKVMMFMPLIFSVSLIFFPFGLVLYIFVNTFVSVIQQYMMQHDLSTRDLFTKLVKRVVPSAPLS